MTISVRTFTCLCCSQTSQTNDLSRYLSKSLLFHTLHVNYESFIVELLIKGKSCFILFSKAYRNKISNTANAFCFCVVTCYIDLVTRNCKNTKHSKASLAAASHLRIGLLGPLLQIMRSQRCCFKQFSTCASERVKF